MVKRDDGRIIFVGRVDARAHREYMWCLTECRRRGYQDIVLDFSQML